MRVGHLVASLDAEWGGPPQTVVGIAQSTAPLGVQSEILTLTNRRSGHMLQTDASQVQAFPAGRLSAVWPGFHPSLVSQVIDLAGRVDVLHAHELWVATTAMASLAAWRRDKPLVISVHGTLDPWAFAHHHARKAVFWRAYQRRSLAAATAVHVLTEIEAAEVRGAGIGAPCVVIPNGVACDRFGLGFAERVEEYFPRLAAKTVIASLGRIHPKKNLEALCRAFVTLRQQIPIGPNGELHLVVAGDGEASYVASLRNILASAGALEASSWPGLVVGDRKAALLARADVFVLPSISEGFSVVVLEALASGTAVAVSPACKFREVESDCAGVVAGPDAGSLTAALKDLLSDSNTGKRLEEMGTNARTLALNHYDWPVIGQRFATMYKDIVSARPAGVG